MRDLLVSGASGQLGRQVVEALIAQGFASRLIATTRNPLALESLKPKGIELRQADFEAEPAEIAKHFKGAERMLLISTDAVTGRREQHEKAIQAAKAAGIKHIIYTSIYESPSLAGGVGADHMATEKALFSSGLTFSILRHHYYADNLVNACKAALLSGTLIGSAGRGKVAFVTRKDCAIMAAQVLANGQKASVIYNVTGPQALSYSDVAELLTKLEGRPVKYLNLSTEAHEQSLIAMGFAKGLAKMMTAFDQSFRLGEAERVSSDVAKILGRPAETLKDFLQDIASQN